MSVISKLITFAGPLLLLALTALAAYAYSQIRHLSLPIPQALGLFSVVLPLNTLISIRGVYGLISRSSSNEQYQLTIPLMGVLGFQLIYETIITTLAVTYMLPPSSLQCGLRDKWLKMYRDKDERAIKAIQDAFDCCGFGTVKEMAWPFQTPNKPSVCGEAFGRTRSCLGPWRQSEQLNAGIFLFVALIVFTIKIISLLSLLTSSSWTHSRWVRPFRPFFNSIEDSDGNRARMRRLTESGDANHVEEYLDNPLSGDTGPRVEPSPLMNVDGETEVNQWSDEGAAQRTNAAARG